jgi:hypothetical protein
MKAINVRRKVVEMNYHDAREMLKILLLLLIIIIMMMMMVMVIIEGESLLKL